MAFRDTRLDPGISYRPVGGSVWDTDVVINEGGYEKRNANRSVRMGEWIVSYDARFQAKWELLCDFFDNVGQGKVNTWRLKDWFDFHVSLSSQGILVQLTSTTWQMYRRRAYGSFTRDKLIMLPVSGTITIAGTGTYTVNYATGVVTKSAGSDPTGWTGDYDKLCRFDIDRNQSSILDRAGGAFIIGWPQIPIKEVFE